VGLSVAKDYGIRLKCPYGDEDRWVLLEDRDENLQQVLTTPWDFECSVHGVQREIPLEASVDGLPPGELPRKEPTARGTRAIARRLSKRLPLHVPVAVYASPKDESTFLEGTSTLLVNAGGGLVALTKEVELGETVVLVNKATGEQQACRVAYIGPKVEGKIRVGIAFLHSAPDFWKTTRQEPRMPKMLRVWIRGEDHNSNPFVQTAYTIDISQHGARLDGVAYLTGPGKTIEVTRHWQKARFRVIWAGPIGTAEANQIGVYCLEPENYLWDARLSRPEAPHPESALTVVPPETENSRHRELHATRSQERRPDELVDLRVPVAVRWAAQDGSRQEEEATARVVNDSSCVVTMKVPMIEGTPLQLFSRSTGKACKGKVVWCGAMDPEGRHLVAIEVEKADPQFWSPA